jgi:hypothetical protein
MRDIADNWNSEISFNSATFMYVSNASTRISIGKLWYFCFQWFQVRGGCSLCWYKWNCWSSLLTISFHNIQCMHRIICTTKFISYKICSHRSMCISYWLWSFVVFCCQMKNYRSIIWDILTLHRQYLCSVIAYEVYVDVAW